LAKNIIGAYCLTKRTESIEISIFHASVTVEALQG